MESAGSSAESEHWRRALITLAGTIIAKRLIDAVADARKREGGPSSDAAAAGSVERSTEEAVVLGVTRGLERARSTGTVFVDDIDGAVSLSGELALQVLPQFGGKHTSRQAELLAESVAMSILAGADPRAVRALLIGIGPCAA